MNILVIGGSRNIGYYASLRFLAAGHTVTFLLRNPSVFDNDEQVQQYLESNTAHLVKGDALVRADVERTWAAAAANSTSGIVDLLLFSVGGYPEYNLFKGIVLSPPNLVTHALLNTLSTLPSSLPNIITLSSTGLTRSARATLPLPLRLLYAHALGSPHRDKIGAERVISHVAGWAWNTRKDKDGEPVAEVLDPEGRWRDMEGMPAEGTLKDKVLVIRPALLTDGECLTDKANSSGASEAYRVSVGEEEPRGWTVSRRDVAHFVAHAALNRWDEFKGKRVCIMY